MKALQVINMLLIREPHLQATNKKAIKNTIRMIADQDEIFQNSVFELGVSVMTKEILKPEGE